MRHPCSGYFHCFAVDIVHTGVLVYRDHFACVMDAGSCKYFGGYTPFRMIYRTMIKAVVVLYILHKTLIDYMVYIPYGTLTERMEQFILHMPPYIWFSLCAWVMLEAALRLVNSTRRILVFLAVNIISLGILDSFTQIPLWVEIAWVMFAGMGWLVCQHFRNYQLQYPQGWKRMIRYPYKILANIAIIFH